MAEKHFTVSYCSQHLVARQVPLNINIESQFLEIVNKILDIDLCTTSLAHSSRHIEVFVTDDEKLSSLSMVHLVLILRLGEVGLDERCGCSELLTIANGTRTLRCCGTTYMVTQTVRTEMSQQINTHNMCYA